MNDNGLYAGLLLSTVDVDVKLNACICVDYDWAAPSLHLFSQGHF